MNATTAEAYILTVSRRGALLLISAGRYFKSASKVFGRIGGKLQPDWQSIVLLVLIDLYRKRLPMLNPLSLGYTREWSHRERRNSNIFLKFVPHERAVEVHECRTSAWRTTAWERGTSYLAVSASAVRTDHWSLLLCNTWVKVKIDRARFNVPPNTL